MIYHRRCSNCGRDVPLFTSTEEHDVLCPRCQTEISTEADAEA